MSFWQVTCGGVTKDAAAWGISGLKRKRQAPVDTDKVMFRLDGTPFDSVLPFAYLQPLSITRNGVPWFSGVVTNPQPKGTAKSESISYEISGPWYWLEKTSFQQQWTQITFAGGGEVTSTTAQSETILSQALNGVKLNSGQVLREVLIYAQYAQQFIPFPTTVDVNNLPPSPSTPGPFIIGTITPNITVPYMSVRDKSCADIIRQMMKYSPDAVAWFDYTTSPPTLNIGRRGDIQGKTITLFPPPGSPIPKLATAFTPTPRYDLQVPCVVAKFLQTNTIEGTSYAQTVVQVYPPAPAGVNAEAWASQPRAWVQTIDLVGGHTTSQSADMKVIPRPSSPIDPVAQTWMLYKEPWLKQTVTGLPGDAYLYDFNNVQLFKINVTIDQHDPLNDPNKNPNNISLPGCPQLINELLTTMFPPWLQDDPNDLDAAKVVAEVWLEYLGTDPTTQALFFFDPTNPTKAKTDGTGYIIHKLNSKFTNASTELYSQITSWSAAEPVPTGFAQYLYECLAPLHFQGELTMIEQECSDQLPCGCIFNTTDGNPDWRVMNALVLSVTEDVDMGTTVVSFGPPAFLNLAEMEQLFRANLGILPSYKLAQRVNGMTATGSNVIGGVHAADTSTTSAPTPPSAVQIGPFTIEYGTNPGGTTYFVIVKLNGVILNTDGSNVTLTIPGTGGKFNLDGNDTLWLEGSVSSLATSSIAIKSYGNSDSGLTNPNAYWETGSLTENDGALPPNQTIFRKVLATFVAGGTGQPVLTTRQTTTNLQLFIVPLLSESALYPYPI